jgi:molecular chaperone DnaJ
MAEKRDYYQVLGVERTVTPDELKKAYRRRARELHPDVNQVDPHAEEHFKELGEAYAVLSDAQKRAAYDHYGHAGLSGASAGGGSPFEGGDFGFTDLFENFFGGVSGGRPDPRGADLRYDLEISLEEAATGVQKPLRFPRQMACGKCGGTGAESGDVHPCPACAGTGQRRQTSSTFFGVFTTVVPCDRCGATGELITHPCAPCGGHGRVRGQEELTIEIPPGVETGTRLRYREKGDAGIHGAAGGALIVVLHLQPHPVFQRQGADLLCAVQVPYTTAVLGGHVTIPTLDGPYDLEITPGTQVGQQVRIRGKGMPRLQATGRGDLYVEVAIPVPTDLTPRQRELMRDLAHERGESVAHKPKNVFQKVKEVVGEVMDDYRDRSKDAVDS